MLNIRKAFPLLVVFTSTLWSAPSLDKHHKFGLFSIFSAFSTENKPNLLAKKAALQWKQTGTTLYFNANESGVDTLWDLSSRDTMIYDIDGNEILRKSSIAESGWDKDSLEIFDSTIFQNGKITEEISYLNDCRDGYPAVGSRSTYAYLDGGRTIVTVRYRWNGSLSKWTLSYKDSNNFFNPINNIFDLNDIVLHSFMDLYRYHYDTTNLSWKCDEYYVKVDEECNATTLVWNGKKVNDNDSLVDLKQIGIFNSSVWNNDNLLESRLQERDPVTGEYHDTYKEVKSADGNSTCEYFNWDSESKALVYSNKDIYFKDSYNNDTLELSCSYDQGNLSWDTTSKTRYIRSYDSYGNNICIIELFYDFFEKTWTINSKKVNSFAQINVPVIHFNKAFPGHNVSIKETAGLIRFSAQGITAVEFYNTQGRLIVSVKQNATNSVTLNLSGPNARISSGSYIAKLVCKDVIKSFPIIIKK
jgi:hypothetical protein